jgi:hypothetical protein
MLRYRMRRDYETSSNVNDTYLGLFSVWLTTLSLAVRAPAQ